MRDGADSSPAHAGPVPPRALLPVRWVRPLMVFLALASGAVAVSSVPTPPGASASTRHPNTTRAAEPPRPAAPGAPPAPGLRAGDPGPHGYFQYHLAPGSSVRTSVTVQDRTRGPATYLVYVARATTAPVGGVAYSQPGGVAGTPSAWVTPSRTEVRVAPGRPVVVPIRVRVPRATTPGDYVTGIAAQAASPAAVGTTGGRHRLSFLVSTRTVIAVVVRVPGPAAPGALFEKPLVSLQLRRRQVVTLPVEDTGGLLMKPYLKGSLSHCSGGAVRHIARQLDTFVPHTSIQYPWYQRRALPAGCYHIALALFQAEGGRELASYEGTVRVSPQQADILPPAGLGAGRPRSEWLTPGYAAGATLLIGCVALLLARRRRRASPRRRHGSRARRGRQAASSWR